jgi:hypothetical protein
MERYIISEPNEPVISSGCLAGNYSRIVHFSWKRPKIVPIDEFSPHFSNLGKRHENPSE